MSPRPATARQFFHFQRSAGYFRLPTRGFPALGIPGVYRHDHAVSSTMYPPAGRPVIPDVAVAPDGYGQVNPLVDSLRTPDTKHKVRIGIKGFVRALFPDLQLRIRRIIDKPDDVVLFVCRQLQRQAEQPGAYTPEFPPDIP